MWRSVTAFTTIVCLLVCSCASYTMQLIDHQEMMNNPDYKIAAVITKAGEYLEFDPDAVLKDSLIVGYVSDGPSISVALSDVDSIYVRRESHLDHARYVDSVEGSRLDEQEKRSRLRAAGCIMGVLVGLGVIGAIYLLIDSLHIGEQIY